MDLWITRFQMLQMMRGNTTGLKKKKKKYKLHLVGQKPSRTKKQRFKWLDCGLQHEMERTNMAAIRCVICPSRLDGSLSREKQELETWVWKSRLWNGFNILPLPPSLFLPGLCTPFVISVENVDLLFFTEGESTHNRTYLFQNALLNNRKINVINEIIEFIVATSLVIMQAIADWLYKTYLCSTGCKQINKWLEL